ncbi:MAG: hypothetical protein FJ088_10775, partial [Deltaproteobacteria bacterium]|nr:hypothetical protein [Deltaproteobacteria bacterium]
LVEACETALLAGNKKLAREMSEKVDKKLIDGKKAEKTLERCLDAAESK